MITPLRNLSGAVGRLRGRVNGSVNRRRPPRFTEDVSPVTSTGEGSRTTLPRYPEIHIDEYCSECGDPSDIGFGDPPVPLCVNCFIDTLHAYRRAFRRIP